MQAADFIALVQRGDAAGASAELARDPGLVRARTQQGVSVICLAVYRQLGTLAAALAAQRDDLDLFEAACLGDRARCAQLLAANPDALQAVSPDGFSALGYSAFFGHVELLRDLLARGADVHAASKNGMRVQPLHSAAAQGDQNKASELARLLLQAGADPNAKQQGGYTPLHEAALNGKLTLIELLLSHGADPKLGSDKGETAVELARKAGHEEAVRKLEGAARPS
jgi:uncharacterized protein